MMLNGVIVDASPIKGPEAVSSKEAEPRVVLAALENARKNGFVGLHVLLDSQEVVKALRRYYDWSTYPIILDMKALASLLSFVEFEYVPRALNGQAHRLAKFCYYVRQELG